MSQRDWLEGDDEAEAARKALDDIYRQELRQATREGYGTVGQARAERDPTAGEVERERYAEKPSKKDPPAIRARMLEQQTRKRKSGRGRGL